MPINFHLAPAAKAIDGLAAIPMDIQPLQASVIFNAVTQITSVNATIKFITGNQNGCPVFDLRQTITRALLEGAAILIAHLAHPDFGGGLNADRRISATRNTYKKNCRWDCVNY